MSREQKGWLAQVNTGEGKTMVVAIVAAVRTLCGETVDIVTSSPELLNPIPQEDFFQTLGISVSRNTDNISTEDKRKVYAYSVVYGTTSSFQGDILRHEFKNDGCRGGRGFGVVIIDEVDNMLIDNRNTSTMLSENMPGMQNIEHVYFEIWRFLEGVKQLFVFTQNDILFCKDTDKNVFVSVSGDTLEKKNKNFSLMVKQMIGEHISNLVYKKDTLHIPAHVLETVKNIQIKAWAESAFNAHYLYKNEKHYRVDYRLGKIVPIDSTNTGVTQPDMNWSNGLHQFLQIKHGVTVTAESFSSNFLSNVTFFQKYKTIYGLTGTLGSEKAVSLLKSFYKLGVFVVPSFMKKRHRRLEGVVKTSSQEWLIQIADDISCAVWLGRSVLVILKYVKDVSNVSVALSKILWNRNVVHKIKQYSTEHDSEVKENEMNEGDIIIATNIAGRGTDLCLSKCVQQNGGLHVILGFLPENERVELQNIGRASRAGQMGTSRIIVLDEKQQDIGILVKERIQKEQKVVEKAKNEMDHVQWRDYIFSTFCYLSRKIKRKKK